MRIAVIGTGRVGGALGTGWARAGHDVTFGSREPKSADGTELLARSDGKARIASVPDSVKAADVVVLAIPWDGAKDTLLPIASSLAGKVLVDCTNPVKAWPSVDHSLGSACEQVAAMVTGARVVKAFNTTGFENMEKPMYAEGPVTMFYAGNDPGAKRTVHTLAKDLGFDPVDAGGLAQAYALEVLASFWGNLAYGQKMGRGIAFRLMRRSG